MNVFNGDIHLLTGSFIQYIILQNTSLKAVQPIRPRARNLHFITLFLFIHSGIHSYIIHSLISHEYFLIKCLIYMSTSMYVNLLIFNKIVTNLHS